MSQRMISVLEEPRAPTTMSTMDGQDSPNVIFNPSLQSILLGAPIHSQAAMPQRSRSVTPSCPPQSRMNLRPPSPTDLTAYHNLKEFMNGYPSYFDSSIPEERRLQWAMDNLPDEFQQFEAKRVKFEQDREAWQTEMEELKAKRLFILRKEVVRAWMDQEERNWAESRASWAIQKRAIEDILKQDVDKLIREVSHLRNGHVVGATSPSQAVLPTYPETYINRVTFSRSG